MASSSIERVLAGKNTLVNIKNYADSVFVTVTQLEKLGCMIRASIPPTAPLNPAPLASEFDPHPSPPISPAVELTHLLGQAPSEHLQTLHALYASQIATIIWTFESELAVQLPRRNVVLAICLAKSPPTENQGEEERTLFRGVMQLVRELLSKE